MSPCLKAIFWLHKPNDALFCTRLWEKSTHRLRDTYPNSISSTPSLCSDCRRKRDETKSSTPGEPRPARSHRTDRPLGCRRGTRSVLLPPTPFLIFSFHGFAIKSNYSLVIFMGSQGTPNERIKDRATQKTIANSKPQDFQLRSRAATGEPMWSLDVWGTKALHKVFLPDLNRSPDC